MNRQFTLISHTLCPYVQRVAITLHEKGIAFERRNIDLADKPDWFLAISPLGKTPVLLVDGQAIFESSVICEYLDETIAPRLHPQDALIRAQHRGWMEFSSTILNNIGSFYNAKTKEALAHSQAELKVKFERLEHTLDEGNYFSGQEFSMIDVVFGSVFRYFDVFDRIIDHDIFEHTPKLNHWRAQLAQRPSIKAAVHSEYSQLLTNFLRQRQSELSLYVSKGV